MLQLDAKLERARVEKGFASSVFFPKSLGDENIDDVAYTTFNTWKVGSAKGDDGVLLVLATAERKMRIETGKGVGGGLTDIGSSHINRDVIGPLMKQAQYYEAADKGTDAILNELTAGTPGGASDEGKKPGARTGHSNGRHGAEPPPPMSLAKMVMIGVGILAVIILSIVSPTFRQILFFFLPLRSRRWWRRWLRRRWWRRRLGLWRRRRQLGRRRLERRLLSRARRDQRSEKTREARSSLHGERFALLSFSQTSRSQLAAVCGGPLGRSVSRDGLGLPDDGPVGRGRAPRPAGCSRRRGIRALR